MSSGVNPASEAPGTPRKTPCRSPCSDQRAARDAQRPESAFERGAKSLRHATLLSSLAFSEFTVALTSAAPSDNSRPGSLARTRPTNSRLAVVFETMLGRPGIARGKASRAFGAPSQEDRENDGQLEARNE